MPNEIKIIATKLASEFEPKEPEFLWFPYLPRKTLTVIQGDSGYGKSSFILNIAARLSNGEHMPFVQSSEPAEMGNTLYFIDEDDKESMVVPRLINIGADRSKIAFINEVYRLTSDCSALEDTIRKLNSRLVIIDPITQYLDSKFNMNIAQGVGSVMRELSRVAAQTDSTIVCIVHLTKNASGKEIDRHLGSSDISNAARSVLYVSRDNEDSDISKVKQLKCSLSKRGEPFYYEIVGNGMVEFVEETETVDDLPHKEPTKQEKAKLKLLELLSNGAAVSREEIEKATQLICSWSTVEDAKTELGNIESRRGKGGIYYWQMKS